MDMFRIFFSVLLVFGILCSSSCAISNILYKCHNSNVTEANLSFEQDGQNFTYHIYNQSNLSDSDETELNCSSTELITRTIKFDQNGENYFNFKTGQLFLSEFNYFPQFCISSTKPELKTIEIQICPEKSHTDKIIIPKCCPEWELIEINEQGDENCVPVYNNQEYNGIKWEPKFLNEETHCPVPYEEIPFQSRLSPIFHWDMDNWICHSYSNRDIYDEFWIKKKFHLTQNGEILFKKEHSTKANKWEIIDKKNFYCLDNIVNSNMTIAEALIICEPNHKMMEDSGNYKIYLIAFSIGIFFLSLTVMIYLLIWEVHNIHGWTFFFYALSLLFMYLFLMGAHTIPSKYTGTWICVLIGVCAHFFYLSTFCWISTISFDLYYTFRKLSPTVSKSKERFRCYLAFSWGIPVLIIVCGLILDSVFYRPNDDMCKETSVITPLYGIHACFVAPLSRGPYLYYPVGILLGVNILFFFLTVRQLCIYKKNSKNVLKNSSAKDKTNFILFAKLFILMGVSWLFELISWTCCLKNSKQMKLHWVILMDCINIIQAVAIFYIFCLQPQIFSRLWSKYPCLRGILRPLTYIFKSFRTPESYGTQSITRRATSENENRKQNVSVYRISFSMSKSNPSTSTSST